MRGKILINFTVMKKRYQVKITRTAGEWRVIDEIIPVFSDSGWCGFWKKSIASLRELYRERPDSITTASGEKEIRCIELTTAQYTVLKDISERMKKPITSVLDELILSPTLRSK